MMQTPKPINFLLKNIGLLFTFLSLIIAGITSYFQWFHTEKVIIEVQCVDKMSLTQLPKIDGLQAQFTFKDSPISQELWKVKYLLKNIGDKNIIGEGSNSLLLSEKLPILVSKNSQILDIEITNNNNGAILENGEIEFKQWRPGEYMEITAYIEHKDTPPGLAFNNRDIIDSEIIYTNFIDSQKINNNIIDNLPEILVIIFKFIYTVIYVFIVCALCMHLFSKENKNNSRSEKISLALFTIVMIATITLPFLWMF